MSKRKKNKGLVTLYALTIDKEIWEQDFTKEQAEQLIGRGWYATEAEARGEQVAPLPAPVEDPPTNTANESQETSDENTEPSNDEQDNA